MLLPFVVFEPGPLGRRIVARHETPFAELPERLQHSELTNKNAARLVAFASYKEGATRGEDGINTVHAVVFDFDHMPRGSLEKTVRGLAQKGHAFWYYTTHSHAWTGEDRFRAVFPLARGLPPDAWRQLAQAFIPAVCPADMIDYLDPRSYVPAQGWYEPAARPEDIDAFAVSDLVQGDVVQPDVWLARAPALPARSLSVQGPEKSHVVSREDLEAFAALKEKSDRPHSATHARVARSILAGTAWGTRNRHTDMVRFIGALSAYVDRRYDAAPAPESALLFASSCEAVTAAGVNSPTDPVWIADLFATVGQGAIVKARASRVDAEPLGLEKLFTGVPANDGKPTILQTLDEPEVIRQALEALRADPTAFVRNAKIVTVCADESRDDNDMYIQQLSTPAIRTRLVRQANFMTLVKDEVGEPEPKRARPEPWLVQGVAGCESPGLRPLAGVIQTPTLRPDGSLLASPGYDEPTKLYLARTVDLTIPEAPTLLDAQEALRGLLDLTCDFPFVSDVDKAVWVALVLTRAARKAVKGVTPMFCIEASTRGTGKGLLAQVACAITLGHEQPIEAWTRDQDEVRKSLHAVALEGRDCVFYDNLDTGAPLGGGPLEMAVTAGRLSGRILGKTETAGGELAVTWIATGNNVVLTDDMLRRTLTCRLDANCPNPERRTGFRYPDVLAHVCENQPRYLSAALTILRAFHLAGRPRRAQALGSFGPWSELIASAVVWVGLPDPISSQSRSAEERIDDGEAARVALVSTIFELQKAKPTGVHLRDLVPADVYALYKDAVESCVHGWGPGGSLTVQQVGELLKKMRGRVVETAHGALKLTANTDRKGANVWRTELLSRPVDNAAE